MMGTYLPKLGNIDPEKYVSEKQEAGSEQWSKDLPLTAFGAWRKKEHSCAGEQLYMEGYGLCVTQVHFLS